jgi:GTP-binding protein
MPSVSKLPLIVIFGRTNVGKSTLFNCLVEKRQALISDTPGTTRDSNIATVEWRGHQFELVDTGGFMNLDFLSQRKIKAVSIDELVQKQARDYLKKGATVIFVVDAKDGLLPQDKQMASILKRIIPDLSKVIIIANKVDAFKRIPEVSDFYNLGLGQVYPVSAATGAGTGDMLDAVLEHLNIDVTKNVRRDDDEDEEEVNKEEMTESEQEEKRQKELAAQPIKVCILGKPNVGKSSLLNAILGYNRVIVSEVPHTTREPQSTNFTYKDKPLVLVDTAGITKHGHKSHTLEKFSMDKSLASLKKSDIALLILDINDPLTKQDSRLVEEIFDRKKSLILVANKWDLADERDTKKFTNYIYGELPFATHAPIQFISAKNNSKVDHLLDLVLKVDSQRHVTLSQSNLDWLMKTAVKKHRPTKGRGTKYPRLYAFTQTGTNPPTFMVRVGARESLADSYLRFLENQLREKFGFTGTPISMWVQKGRDVHGAHDS